MRQRAGFDHRWALAYLALAVGGCSGPGSVVPVDAAPVDRTQVDAWVTATLPPANRLHRFKWLFQDERSSTGGRGSARIAPPDSLRFDVAGPFGSGAASAAVIGDHPLWTEPPDAVSKLVPNYPLLWAMFGVARLPESGDSLRGVVHGDVTAWRYIDGADTVSYLHTAGSAGKLVAEVRHGGELVGRAETMLDGHGAPLASKLVVPGVPAKLALTFLSTGRADFAPDIWTAHRP
jgi:hypothetical protein